MFDDAGLRVFLTILQQTAQLNKNVVSNEKKLYKLVTQVSNNIFFPTTMIPFIRLSYIHTNKTMGIVCFFFEHCLSKTIVTAVKIDEQSLQDNYGEKIKQVRA